MSGSGRRLAVAVSLVLAAAALVGVATVGGATMPSVRAIVTRGPVVPVCREGTPCDEPAAAVSFVVRSRGRVVARAVTDALGRFALRLEPGAYVVSLARLPAIGGLAPRRFVVRAGRVTTLRLQMDTGIR